MGRKALGFGVDSSRCERSACHAVGLHLLPFILDHLTNFCHIMIGKKFAHMHILLIQLLVLDELMVYSKSLELKESKYEASLMKTL
eukprot:COSAG05_NODE_813_length_7167_cov_7.376627_1_plen_86_part_00